MNNQIEKVSSTTRQNKASLQEQIVKQLMVFNKCTYERALCMYKEMMQTIADYYLLEKVSSATRKDAQQICNEGRTMQEIEVFAKDVCNAYGLIEENVNQLAQKLC